MLISLSSASVVTSRLVGVLTLQLLEHLLGPLVVGLAVQVKRRLFSM